MAPNKEALNKEDLYLLLESYKNSVEMNTLISQQLTTILDALNSNKEYLSDVDDNIKEKLKTAAENCVKINDKMEVHDKETLKSHSKLMNKINLLYVGIGSIVIALIVLMSQLWSKYDQVLHTVTKHLGGTQ